MKAKVVQDADVVTYVVVGDAGDADCYAPGPAAPSRRARVSCNADKKRKFWERSPS